MKQLVADVQPRKLELLREWLDAHLRAHEYGEVLPAGDGTGHAIEPRMTAAALRYPWLATLVDDIRRYYVSLG